LLSATLRTEEEEALPGVKMANLAVAEEEETARTVVVVARLAAGIRLPRALRKAILGARPPAPQMGMEEAVEGGRLAPEAL
jgi:hypothetical protein